MYITVCRGGLVEAGTADTRLLLAAGAGLPPSGGPQDREPFQMEGLTCGTPAFDWVLLTGQRDHLGLLDSLLPGIDVLAVDGTAEALCRLAQAKGKPELYFRLREGRTVRLDDIQVTPLGGVLLLEAEGKAVAYAEAPLTGGALETLRERTGPDNPPRLLLWEDGGVRLDSRPLRDGERVEIE